MNWDEKLKTDIFKNIQGFTLVELAVAITVGLVAITAIYMTFTSQQDSYAVQTQISATQQNLRGAMYKLTQDIQMAGYYTNFVKEAYTMNWDNLGGDEDKETIKPVIYGRSDITESGYRQGSDVLVLVQADRDISKSLSAGDEISAGDPTTIPGSLRNITTGTGDELKAGYYGLLVKQDFSGAELFRVSGVDESDFNAVLKENYGEKDLIFRVDIFYYFVDDSLNLRRKNLSTGANETVAENIENLQVRYHLNSGISKFVLNDNEVSSVRAVEIALLGRTDKPVKGYNDTKTYNMAGQNFTPAGDDKKYQRRLLTTTILTRNIGL